MDCSERSGVGVGVEWSVRNGVRDRSGVRVGRIGLAFFSRHTHDIFAHATDFFCLNTPHPKFYNTCLSD